MEFGVFGDLGLEKDYGLLRVEARGQEIYGDLEGVFGYGGSVGVIAGQGVPVGYEVEAVVGGIVLEADPVLESAEIVADVETAGGAHAGEDSFRSGRCGQVVVLGREMVNGKGYQISAIRYQEEKRGGTVTQRSQRSEHREHRERQEELNAETQRAQRRGGEKR
jgi:hypothetical protein